MKLNCSVCTKWAPSITQTHAHKNRTGEIIGVQPLTKQSPVFEVIIQSLNHVHNPSDVH